MKIKIIQFIARIFKLRTFVVIGNNMPSVHVVDGYNLFLDSRGLYLDEREKLLDLREKIIEKKEEMVLGKDGAEAKRSILLPAMKKKWEAEAGRIESERIETLKQSSDAKGKLDKFKNDVSEIILSLKKKPGNLANSDLLKHNLGKLEGINEVFSLIDEVKNEING